MARLWIDIGALFAVPRVETGPADMLRFTLEIGRALHVAAPDEVGFVRQTGGPQDWICLNWDDLQDLPGITLHRTGALHVTGRQVASHSQKPMETLYQTDVKDAVRTQIQALRAGLGIFEAVARYGLQKWQDRRARHAVLARTARARKASVLSGASLKELARPGDLFLAPVPIWEREDYVQTVRWLRDTLRVQFGVFVHDLLPIQRPEWFRRQTLNHYAPWHEAILPLADQIFVNSAATAQDVTGYLERIERSPLRPIVTVPLGSGPDSVGSSLRQADRKVVPDGEYVLCVGTLEPRVNHELLLRVWRRLLQSRGAGKLPKLVLVGQVGWLVTDVLQQLENSDWLDGYVQLVSAPSDGLLTELYRNCLFTIVPALSAGWSAPVMESLHHTRPCLAAKSLANRVDDQGLVRYFDPLNLHDALQAIEGVLDDREGLKQWAGDVKARFSPISWHQSAETILRHI